MGLMLPDESVLSASDGLTRAAFRGGHAVAATATAPSATLTPERTSGSDGCVLQECRDEPHRGERARNKGQADRELKQGDHGRVDTLMAPQCERLLYPLTRGARARYQQRQEKSRREPARSEPKRQEISCGNLCSPREQVGLDLRHAFSLDGTRAFTTRALGWVGVARR